MKQKVIIATILILSSAFSVALATYVVQERKIKKVTRAKRPTFTERDWDGVYFENLYKEGLVGERPKPSATVTPGTTVADSGNDQSSEQKGFSWANHISGETIENEVKAISNSLARDITSPVKFKSDYGKVHQSFAMLSMLFAIIREYDGDVRWQRFAPDAQASFERAAASSRTGTSQAFESCKRRKEGLAEMVRGGNFGGEDKAPEQLDWSAVIERSPIMDRLQVAYGKLKIATSNEKEFAKNTELIRSESELIAAMAQTLIQENMTDAEEDSYKEFAVAMSDAANTVVQGCKTKDYKSAAQGVNLINQSCSNCHDEWQ